MRRRWLPVLAVLAALVLVGLGAQGAGLQWAAGETDLRFEGEGQAPELEFPTESPMPSEPTPTEVGEGFSLPPWVSWMVLAILIGIPVALLLLVLAKRFVSWLIVAQAGPPPGEPERPMVRRDMALVEQAVAAGLAEIDLGTDPRSAILACWVHFENAAETVGIAREASDTPSDFVGRLLAHHDLDRSSLAQLSGSYLRARYSPHEVGETDRDTARSALIDLQGQLGVREVQ